MVEIANNHIIACGEKKNIAKDAAWLVWVWQEKFWWRVPIYSFDADNYSLVWLPDWSVPDIFVEDDTWGIYSIASHWTHWNYVRVGSNLTRYLAFNGWATFEQNIVAEFYWFIPTKDYSWLSNFWITFVDWTTGIKWFWFGYLKWAYGDSLCLRRWDIRTTNGVWTIGSVLVQQEVFAYSTSALYWIKFRMSWATQITINLSNDWGQSRWTDYMYDWLLWQWQVWMGFYNYSAGHNFILKKVDVYAA